MWIGRRAYASGLLKTRHKRVIWRDRDASVNWALDLRHLQRVKHVLVNLSPTRPFSQLRKALFEAYEPSMDSKLDELLDAAELGDRRTTHRVAIAHATPNGNWAISNSTKKLFLSKLPVDVKRVVVASGTDSIDELAERADRVLAADSVIDTTSRRYENQKLAQCDQSLKERINDLIDRVDEHVNCPQNPRYQPQLFARSLSPEDKKFSWWENSLLNFPIFQHYEKLTQNSPFHKVL